MRRLPSTLAATHPPRYRLHKYWSRKPHNVVREFVAHLLPTPGVVVDPFAGSGVPLLEAAGLGHETHGADVNPVAVLLARVTGSAPDPDRFVTAVGHLLDRVEAELVEPWQCPQSGRTIRYVVHALVSACPQCGTEQTAAQSRGDGRARKCHRCGAHLRFNLETACRTEVTAYTTQGHKEAMTDPVLLAHQQSESIKGLRLDPDDPLLTPFVDNRRILAFGSRSPSDLFTPRALKTLLRFRQLARELPDRHLRDAAMLLLTASAAQCSRLTAFRNNLSTGGPAWSVPGFWVPPLHLETNPTLHLRARLRRFERGLHDAVRHRDKAATAPHVVRGDAATFLRDLGDRGVKADLVILDPPYGDSVPFVEFSSFWNALLGETADARLDLSVSDRRGGPDPWGNYRSATREVVANAAALLAPRGQILLSFNNHDLRAWKALLRAIQAAHLECSDAVYQHPAVVSSKAAFHPKSSYLGDIWASFRRAPPGWRPRSDPRRVVPSLARNAMSRGGRCTRNLVQRALAMAWLEHDLDADLIDQWPHLIAEHFDTCDGHWLVWRGESPAGPCPPLEGLVIAAATECLANGAGRWRDLLAHVGDACRDYGVPDPGEVLAILGDHIHVRGDTVVLAA